MSVEESQRSLLKDSCLSEKLGLDVILPEEKWT